MAVPFLHVYMQAEETYISKRKNSIYDFGE